LVKGRWLKAGGRRLTKSCYERLSAKGWSSEGGRLKAVDQRRVVKNLLEKALDKGCQIMVVVKNLLEKAIG